ncbi:family 16 glycoside hydrolase, partial [Pseudopedobacter sp.]|uniref:family 16 glycoside hydrolase n=1 Tax=Pseudopedobacter sp. TaxID=1936787 RepID=UPI003341AEC8
AEANPGVTIGLVPCAVGGTAIRKWVPGGYDSVTNKHPYDDALLRIKLAMKKGVIKGVIWHQGEGDSGVKSSQTYVDKLAELIERIRKEVGNPKLPFVVGQLAMYRDNYQYINKELPKLPVKVSYTTIVSSEGLWHKGDGTHFNSPSAAEYGRRFADGMLLLQNKKHKAKEVQVKSAFNSLSDKEKEAGWELLFDGKDPNIRWRSIRGDKFPAAGWTIENEALVLLPGRKGGDIITREQFSDFELMLDYKLADSANTGIKYFVSELKNGKGKIELNGPEFQLIDDYKHETVKDNKSPETSTGSLYLLYAPKDKMLNKPGEWNQVKIISKGKNVEHWINGKKVLSYERGSEEFRKLVANTKFKEYQTTYGESIFGYILLQDHKDKAYFRNIKIRRLK